MATVNGFTAERMLEIEGSTVVAGLVDINGNLLLEKRNGDTINAGYVRGLQGDPGAPGTPGTPGQDGEDRPLAAGVIELFAGSVPPSGWMICNGAAISRTTYSALFAAIGTTYGAGDGSTTFNLPDFRGRLPMGVNPGDADYGVLNAAGGAKTNTHNHFTGVSNDGGNTFAVLSNSLPRSRTATRARAVLAGGSASGATREDSTYDETISILPPFRAIHYIISLGVGGAAGGGSPISAVYVGRGSTAERDAFYGIPSTDPQIVALANQKVVWFNTDEGWWESYYSQTGKAGLVVTGLVNTADSGWYPTGLGPYMRLSPTTTWSTSASTAVRNWDGVTERRGGNGWFQYSSANGRISCQKAGRYKIMASTIQQTGSGTSNHWLRQIYAGAVVKHVDGLAVTLLSAFLTRVSVDAEWEMRVGGQVDLYTQSGTLAVHSQSGTGLRGEFLVRYVGPPLETD